MPHPGSIPSVFRHIKLVTFSMGVLFSALAAAQQRTEQNVVYGMYSGAALLMDVCYADHPNGVAVIVIYGNAWSGA